MKYAYITTTNKHFGKNWKKTLQTNIAANGLYDTRLCGYNTASVTRIIHLNVGLKHFFHLPKFLLLLLVFAYIYISQGSVETHLPCGGIYNNHTIANCLQCASDRIMKTGQ